VFVENREHLPECGMPIKNFSVEMNAYIRFHVFGAIIKNLPKLIAECSLIFTIFQSYPIAGGGSSQ